MVGAAEESDVFMWMRLKTSGCDDIVAVELQGQNIYEDFLFGTITLLFLLGHIPGQPFENCFKSISFYIVWLWILVQGFNSLLLPFYYSHRLWFGVQTDRSAGLQGRMGVLHKYFKIASTGKGWIITPYLKHKIRCRIRGKNQSHTLGFLPHISLHIDMNFSCVFGHW